MALFQPTNITPSTFAGIGSGTVAANDNVSISWQVNGNSPMTGFDIVIYPNTGNASTDATIVHATGLITIDDFYPTDNEGNPQRYTYSPNNTTWTSWGLSDGNQYRMQIIQYWAKNSAELGTKSVRQYALSVFNTRTFPTLVIDNFISPIASVSHTFTATYSQAQEDTIDYVRWLLTDNSDGVILEDTNYVSTQVLSFTYNRFRTDHAYTISCMVQTSSGIVVEASADFSVSYVSTESSGDITLSCIPNNDAAYLKFGKAVSIPGTSTGSYSIGAGVLSLENGGSVAWNTVGDASMNFATPYKLMWSGRCDYTKTQISDTDSFSITTNSQTTISTEKTIDSSSWSISGNRPNRRFFFAGVAPGSISSISVVSWTDFPTQPVIAFKGDLYSVTAQEGIAVPVNPTVILSIKCYAYANTVTRNISAGRLLTARITNVSNPAVSATISKTDDSYTVFCTSYTAGATANITVSRTYLAYSYVFNGDMLQVNTNAIALSQTNGFLTLKVNDTTTLNISIPEAAYEARLLLTKSGATLDLFDGTNLLASHSAELTDHQSNITSLTLNGVQKCNWLAVGTDSYDVSDFDDITFTPTWGSSTEFYATFEFDLEAGTLSSTQSSTAIALYRQNIDTGTLNFLFETTSVIQAIKDYGVQSKTRYSYVLFYITNGLYSAAVVSNGNYCKQFQAYTLIEATQDTTYPEVYHVVQTWRFGANLSVGAVSNNNMPNMLTNFTGYRIKQASSRIGRSGTLQSLLSTPQNRAYADSVTEMERLYKASLSNNTFFLKDMKGNLYMVAISAPITQTQNLKPKEIPVTVSITWEEVGEAAGLSIIQTPSDVGWTE